MGVNGVDPLGLDDKIEYRFNAQYNHIDVYYTNTPSWITEVLTLSLKGDLKPVKLGFLDNDTGLVKMPGNLYTTLSAIEKYSAEWGTDWDEFKKSYCFGRTADDTRALLKSSSIRGNAIVKWQFANETLGAENPFEGPDTIFTGTEMAGDFTKELMTFYATSPLEFANLVKSSAKLSNASKINKAKSVVSHVDDFIPSGWYHGTDIESANDILQNGLSTKNWERLNAIEDVGTFFTDIKSTAVNYAETKAFERNLEHVVIELDMRYFEKFSQGVGKLNECVIPVDAFENIPPSAFRVVNP